jgi:predicted Abi (CAAX) family protease
MNVVDLSLFAMYVGLTTLVAGCVATFFVDTDFKGGNLHDWSVASLKALKSVSVIIAIVVMATAESAILTVVAQATHINAPWLLLWILSMLVLTVLSIPWALDMHRDSLTSAPK